MLDARGCIEAQGWRNLRRSRCLADPLARRWRGPRTHDRARMDRVSVKVEHVPNRQAVIDPVGQLGALAKGLRIGGRLAGVGDRLGHALGRLSDDLPAFEGARLGTDVDLWRLARRPVQREAMTLADLAPERAVAVVYPAMLDDVPVLVLPIRQVLGTVAFRGEPVAVLGIDPAPGVHDVRVPILPATIGLVDDEVHRRAVLDRQPFGVLLDRGGMGSGDDERARDPNHVVAALAGVLALVGRLHAVRPFEGVAPSVGGAGRKGAARLHDCGAVGVVERPGDTVLAEERRLCRQAEAVADHADRRVALGSGLHQDSEKGVGHCSTPGSRVIASAEPAAAHLPRGAAGAWNAVGVSPA